MILRVTDPCRPLAFPSGVPLEVEVGCGKGRFLTGRAAAHPERRFLGIERMPERGETAIVSLQSDGLRTQTSKRGQGDEKSQNHKQGAHDRTPHLLSP